MLDLIEGEQNAGFCRAHNNKFTQRILNQFHAVRSSEPHSDDIENLARFDQFGMSPFRTH